MEPQGSRRAGVWTEPRGSRGKQAGGRAGGLGSLSGAGRRSCEVLVRRARQTARVGMSRPSGVRILTAGLAAALTPLLRRDGALSRAPFPPAFRFWAASLGGPRVFLSERRPCRLRPPFQSPSEWTTSAFSFRAQ